MAGQAMVDSAPPRPPALAGRLVARCGGWSVPGVGLGACASGLGVGVGFGLCGVGLRRARLGLGFSFDFFVACFSPLGLRLRLVSSAPRSRAPSARPFLVAFSSAVLDRPSLSPAVPGFLAWPPWPCPSPSSWRGPWPPWPCPRARPCPVPSSVVTGAEDGGSRPATARHGGLRGLASGRGRALGFVVLDGRHRRGTATAGERDDHRRLRGERRTAAAPRHAAGHAAAAAAPEPKEAASAPLQAHRRDDREDERKLLALATWLAELGATRALRRWRRRVLRRS